MNKNNNLQLSVSRANWATGKMSSHGTVTGHLLETVREPPEAFVKSTIAEIGVHTEDMGAPSDCSNSACAHSQIKPSSA